MPVFIDTSALFKRYQLEEGTDVICRILEKPNQKIFISSITIIEVMSNLKRLFEIDHITTEAQFEQQRLFFYHDIGSLDIKILDINSEDIIKAEGLILKRYMKPVDSIQLGMALNIRLKDLTFVSSDKKLCDIAEQEGLHVFVV